jgi:hypothetical protein
MRQAVSALKGEPYVSRDLIAQVDPVIGQLTGMQNRIRETESRRQHLERVSYAIGRPAEFAQRLREYRQNFPTESRSTDFEKEAKEGPEVWELVARWNPLVTTWSRRDFGRVSRADAVSLLAQANTLLGESTDYPAAEQVSELLPYLTAVAARADADGKNPIHFSGTTSPRSRRAAPKANGGSITSSASTSRKNRRSP